jgi:hypothetical protein
VRVITQVDTVDTREEGERMNTKKLIVAAVAAAIVALGVGGTAYAQQADTSSGASPPAQTQQAQPAAGNENTASDPDNIQEGDQTSPDKPDQAEGPEAGPENSAADPDNVQE